jgi:hypothetical protein
VTDAPSRSAILQARLAAALIVGLLILGAVWYGVSFEDLDRMWRDILARPGGPMTFRFILQPAMAVLAALRDGVHDARTGRRPYLWAMLRGVRSAEGRRGRLWEGIVSTARILILGVVMDAMGGLQDLLSGPSCGHRSLAGVRSLFAVARPHGAGRAPLGRSAGGKIGDWRARPDHSHCALAA